MHYQTRNMLKESVQHLSSLLYNLLYFAKRSPVENDLANLRNLVLSLPSSEKEKYGKECSYLESMSLNDLSYLFIPYPVRKEGFTKNISAGKDGRLSYVFHQDKGKLFFPKNTSLSDAVNEYRGLVEREALLGNGVLECSPHSYQDSGFKVEEGDVLLDVGCAEGIFTFDNIEKVERAYLFESSSEWKAPLQRTFAPYLDKVDIINKCVSGRTVGNEIMLIDVISRDLLKESHFFVKMDVEGAERSILKGNEDFFSIAKVKLSCCVYHRQDDAQVIEAMLKSMGYKTRFSEGYMLTAMNGIHYPYFRHGVIYAQNY